MSQKIGDACTRCDGTGRVYDEVWEFEWSDCPYMDVGAGVACLKGRIVPIDEAMPGDPKEDAQLGRSCMTNWINDPDTGEEWEPAVPLPLYIRRWFGLVKRYGCVCMTELPTEKAYEDHYRGWHLDVGDGERG